LERAAGPSAHMHVQITFYGNANECQFTSRDIPNIQPTNLLACQSHLSGQFATAEVTTQWISADPSASWWSYWLRNSQGGGFELFRNKVSYL